MLSSLRNREVLEAAFWAAGLGAVALANPDTGGLVSVCPFDAIGNLLGLSFCPGCGLGHAVGFLARGQLEASFQSHPFGLPAVLILGRHIHNLLRAPKPRPV